MIPHYSNAREYLTKGSFVNLVLSVVVFAWLKDYLPFRLVFLLLITLYYLKFDILRSLHYNSFREIQYLKNVFQILSSDTWNKNILRVKMRFSSNHKFSVFAKVLYYCKTISNLLSWFQLIPITRKKTNTKMLFCTNQILWNVFSFMALDV